MGTPEIQSADETSLPVWKAPEIVKIELRRTLSLSGSLTDGTNGSLID